MTRREFLIGTTTLAAAGVAHATSDPSEWIGPTRFIDSEHPAIIETARTLAWGEADDRAKARAIFDHVRDAVPFGFSAGFWRLRASEVLSAGRGYCNTKSTLFVALLRAAGVPARQVFVEIDTAVLYGLVDPGTPRLDHSYTEVFLDGAWRATDAYIVDDPLFHPAQARVRREKRVFGYGVHATGASVWDGRIDSFAQYNRADPSFPVRRVWGVFEDVGAFYETADQPWNRLNALLRAGFGVLADGANRRADAIRAGVGAGE